MDNRHALDCRCISSRPIIIGALVAVGLSFLLNLFSAAIGLTAFSADTDGVQNLALGGLMATAFGIIVSMFASGWLTGYLGRQHCGKRHLGALYGFLAWVLALIIMVFVAKPVHEYVVFYTQFISDPALSMALQNNPLQSPSANQAQNALVISTYIVFVLFFLSAFAASFGGHMGMRHKEASEV